MAADSGSATRVKSRMTLHLGVINQPYRSNSKSVRAMTTGDVAKILEDKYGIMGVFYRVRQKDVHKALTDSMQGALESLLMGQRVAPFNRGMGKIQSAFKNFINTRESERVGIAGTPTKAALMGINHRLAHPYRRSNPRRPSFRDTGLYSASFSSWIDG
jgi:hypothetical protein